MLVQLAINLEHLNVIPHSTLYYILCLIFNSNKLATYFVWSPTKTINLYGLIDMISPVSFVYMCFAIGDPVIKRGRMESQ